jgi:hypothetical protein
MLRQSFWKLKCTKSPLHNQLELCTFIIFNSTTIHKGREKGLNFMMLIEGEIELMMKSNCFIVFLIITSNRYSLYIYESCTNSTISEKIVEK